MDAHLKLNNTQLPNLFSVVKTKQKLSGQKIASECCWESTEYETMREIDRKSESEMANEIKKKTMFSLNKFSTYWIQAWFTFTLRRKTCCCTFVYIFSPQSSLFLALLLLLLHSFLRQMYTHTRKYRCCWIYTVWMIWAHKVFSFEAVVCAIHVVIDRIQMLIQPKVFGMLISLDCISSSGIRL